MEGGTRKPSSKRSVPPHDWKARPTAMLIISKRSTYLSRRLCATAKARKHGRGLSLRG